MLPYNKQRFGSFRQMVQQIEQNNGGGGSYAQKNQNNGVLGGPVASFNTVQMAAASSTGAGGQNHILQQNNHQRRSGTAAGRSSRPARNAAVSGSNTSHQNASLNRIGHQGGVIASNLLTKNHPQHVASGGQSNRPPGAELSSAVLSRKVNMIMFGHASHQNSSAAATSGSGTGGNARYQNASPASCVNLKNSLGFVGNSSEQQKQQLLIGGLQSTLNRQSMDQQDPNQFYHQSSSGFEHQSDSKKPPLGVAMVSSSGNGTHTMTRAFMIPTINGLGGPVGEMSAAEVTASGADEDEGQSFRTKRFSSNTQLQQPVTGGVVSRATNQNNQASSDTQEKSSITVIEREGEGKAAIGLDHNHHHQYQIDFGGVRPLTMSHKMIGIATTHNSQLQNTEDTHQQQMTVSESISDALLSSSKQQNYQLQKPQTQDEILTDIQKRFQQLKNLFPPASTQDGGAKTNKGDNRVVPSFTGKETQPQRTGSTLLRSSRLAPMKPLQPALLKANSSVRAATAKGVTYRGAAANKKNQQFSQQQKRTKTATSLLMSDLAAVTTNIHHDFPSSFQESAGAQESQKMLDANFPQRQIKTTNYSSGVGGQQSVRRLLLSRKNQHQNNNNQTADNVNISVMLQHKSSPNRSSTSNLVERNRSGNRVQAPSLSNHPTTTSGKPGHIAVLQLDSEQLFSNIANSNNNNNKPSAVGGSYMSRKHARYMAQQGPIKRLKSAMIRSVFDKGPDFHHQNQQNGHGGLNFNGKKQQVQYKTASNTHRVGKARKSSSNYQSPGGGDKLLSSKYTTSVDDIMSTKGQQLAMPTYTYTTPLLQEIPSDYTSQNGAALRSNTNSSIMQRQNQIFFQHQSALQEQMAAAQSSITTVAPQDYYEQQQQQLAATGTTPAGIPVFFGGVETIYGGLKQNDSYQQLMIGGAAQQNQQAQNYQNYHNYPHSLQQSSSLTVNGGNSNEPQSAYKILPQDASAAGVAAGGVGSSHFIITPASANASESLQKDGGAGQLIGVVMQEPHSAAEKTTSDEGMIATMVARSQQEIDDPAATLNNFSKNKLSQDDGNVVVVPTVGRESHHLLDDEDIIRQSASPDLSTLNQMNPGNNQQSRLSHLYGEQNDRSDGCGTIPIRDSCSPPPQEDQHDFQDDDALQIEAGVVKEEAAGNSSTINLKLTKANDYAPRLVPCLKPLQAQLDHPTELTPSASQDTSQIAAATFQTQQALMFEQMEEKRRQILELELYQRDYQILSVLGQQIKEDYMHMYSLKQDLQSDMVKIDPRYMNKAIIEKIKLQNMKWQQSAMAIKEQSPAYQQYEPNILDDQNINGLVLSSTESQGATNQHFDGVQQHTLIGGENTVAVQIVQRRQDGSSRQELIELANGLHEIQELEQYMNINSGTVHTRTLSHDEHLQGANQAAIQSSQHIVVPAASMVITRRTPEEHQSKFVLHDDGDDEDSIQKRDRIDGQNSSLQLGRRQQVIENAKSTLNPLVTFQDEAELPGQEQEEVLMVQQPQRAVSGLQHLHNPDEAQNLFTGCLNTGNSPLSVDPNSLNMHAYHSQQQNRYEQQQETESTPIRRMEKLLNRFEEYQYHIQVQHTRGDNAASNAGGAPASMHSGTNEDLSVVVDPTDMYNRNSGGPIQGNYPISSMYHNTQPQQTSNSANRDSGANTAKRKGPQSSKTANANNLNRVASPSSHTSWLVNTQNATNASRVFQKSEFRYDQLQQQQHTQPQYQVNVMKPVKKFININKQTRFAEIKQSILQRNESQLSDNRRSKEMSSTMMQYSRGGGGLSACAEVPTTSKRANTTFMGC